MAAGQGFKTFTTGEVLTAGDVNGYLMQGINVFASSAARAAAITSPQEGQYSFLKDTNALEYYDGAAWVGAPVGDITNVAVTSPVTGGGSSGSVTIGIQDASTTQRGSVQLSDSTSTTSSILAATPTAVKSSYDLALAAIPKSTVTTAGDVIYATGSGAVTRLGIGTANQVLRVNSGATAPEWATPASGGGITLISEQVASASTGIDFNSISSSYKNLVLTWDGIYQSAISSAFELRFNNSSATNYKENWQYQETGSTPSLTATGTRTVAGDAAFGVQVTSTNIYQQCLGSLTIYDYASTSKYKYYTMQFSYYSNNNARVNFTTLMGIYADTTAISSINVVRTSGSATISNTSGTSIRLYGVS